MQGSQSQAAKVLGEERTKLIASLDDMPGAIAARKFADATDAYFKARLREVWPAGKKLEDSPFALVAVGGYGRAELCPHSDVDILVIYEKKIPPEALDLAQSMLYPLWDLGLDLGHGFRSIKENLTLARKDFSVLASLLDARFIDGSQKVFDAFVKRFTEKVVTKKKGLFVKWLTRQEQKRFARFGDASALLEPDLKRGRGGLRDFHHILWLGQAYYGVRGIDDLLLAGALTEAQAHVLRDLEQFLLKVRSLLHRISKRRNDHLHLAHQPAIAQSLGFEDRDGVPGVEHFLTRLHRQMAALKAIRASFIHAAEEGKRAKTKLIAPGILQSSRGLEFYLPRGYPDEPHILLDIFSVSASTGEALSWQARGFITGHLFLVKEKLASSVEAARKFMDILCSGRAAFVLEQMMETGFLGAFIPEFGRVQDLVQFDTYHIHPVGWHTIEVVRLLETAKRSGEYGELRVGLASDRTLMLGALFHDIGKGLGGGHSAKGAALVREMLPKWGVEEQDISDVTLLVEDHLSLFEVATRRDLDDESVIAACAMRVENAGRLQRLLLLTWADAKATGPGAWTKWTSSLVNELYAKIRKMVDTGDFAGGETARKVEAARSGVREALAGKHPTKIVEHRLASMPSRYLASVQVDDIVRHTDMTRQLEDAVRDDARLRPTGKGGDGIIVAGIFERAEQECLEIEAAGADDSRLFTALAGVLSLMGMNILSVQGFAWRGGTSIYIIRVTAPQTIPDLESMRVRFVAMVRNALLGNLSVAESLADRRNSLLGINNDDGGVSVSIDNESSDFHTIIEIKAPDRVGLLHDAVRTFAQLGLSVQLAKVTTYGGRAADSFYVREVEGVKVTGVERLRTVQNALQENLN